MTPAAVVIHDQTHASAGDARFALRELQRQWGAPVRQLLGMDWRGALDLLPTGLVGPVLLLKGPMLTLHADCLHRLAQALADGADVAQACDSSRPGPMGRPDYATVRGMERFVSEQPLTTVPVAPDEPAAVELATLQGLRRRLEGRARVVRVAGAWAHDGGAYFASDRAEAIPLLPVSARSLLDVGGGEGAFLVAAKSAHPELRTTLVELTADAALRARQRGGIDTVWQLNFLDWQTDDRFDCISFLDVLEHMADPEQALQRARALLAPGGSVLMSLPNVGHHSVVADLLEGRWDWAPVGIHCYTHLRFFTRPTIVQMLQRVGLQPCQWHEVRVPCPPDWRQQWATPGLALDSNSLDVYAYLVRAQTC